MAMDWAEQQARNALQQFRRGSQINGGCVEVYPAVADAIRDAYKRGKADGVKLGREAELEAALRPFGDAYRFTQQMGSMRREYEASMTCTGKFTVADLHRAAELTKE